MKNKWSTVVIGSLVITLFTGTRIMGAYGVKDLPFRAEVMK